VDISRKGAKARRKNLSRNEIAKEVVDAAYKVHTALGPGLLESAYETVLAHELKQRRFAVTW